MHGMKCGLQYAMKLHFFHCSQKHANQMKRIKQSVLTHPSDWSKLSSMTKSKIRSKETEMEFTRASAFMFRSTQEIWSKMPSGISTFPSRGRAGWPKPAPSLRRPIALSMQVPLIRFASCCRGQEVDSCVQLWVQNMNVDTTATILDDYVYEWY